MQSKRVWARVIGVERDVVIEAVEFDEDAGEIVVSCRLRRGAGRRCGRCGRRGSRYDWGEGRRRWRALDAGTVRVFIEAEAPRVACPEHGVTVSAVPWARHSAGHTRAFDDQVAWLVTHTLEVGGGRVDAGRLAHGGGDRQPGRCRCPSGAGSVRRVGADRDRRDLLSARSSVSDGRRRSRLGSAGVGGGRTRPGHPADSSSICSARNGPAASS